jgi:protocatechuate 3,4-dioxygenase alpha subunit
MTSGKVTGGSATGGPATGGPATGGSVVDGPGRAPGQTVGPFFGLALPYPGGADLVPAGDPGAVRLHGRVLDGRGEPVPDALLELWQADADGRVPREPGSLSRAPAPDHGAGSLNSAPAPNREAGSLGSRPDPGRERAGFTGWGRVATDPDGRYAFRSVEPGPTDPGRAPFLALAVFARGLLDRLLTRVYLPDDPEALAADPLLAGLPAERRATLVAAREPGGLRFDVVLQGERETVFLAHRSAHREGLR